jgi:PhzF family phenazine biosynthesis protein
LPAESGKGNPTGVCLLYPTGVSRWMQMTAREMNLSETAFVVSERNGFGLHWFTPRTEVDF